MGYIEGIMLTALEMICCKIFFEAFGTKKSENKWRNSGVIFALIISVYSLSLFLYNVFFLKAGPCDFDYFDIYDFIF